MYDFLLVRHCNYSSILYHFRVIWHWIISWQWRIQNFIIRGPPRIIKFWPAPSLNFYLKKVGFGAFWYDFLRSERHKKRHIRPAVLILYHSCIRQLSLKGRAQHLLTVLLVEYESYAKIAMVIGGGATMWDHGYGLMHHVVCLFPPQLLLVLVAPTHRGMAKLSMAGCAQIWCTCPKMVSGHPSRH